MPAFTTADASERLAKRQAAKQLGVSAGIGSGVKVKIKKPNLVQSAVKALGSVYDTAKNQPGAQLSSPVNTGAGVSMGGQQNAVQNVVEPVRAAGRRAVGDLTAIPGVGKPSASPTATDFRAGNYVGPILDYVNLAATVAPAVSKGVKATGDVMDASRLAKMNRQLNPFPEINRPTNFIDVTSPQPGSQVARQVGGVEPRRSLPSGPSREALEKQILDNYVSARANATQTPALSDDAKDALLSWIERQQSTATPDDLFSAGFANRQAISSLPVNPYAPEPTISIKAGDLSSVLDTGQYGSMFGAGTSARSENYDAWRMGNEAALYGLQQNDLRPVYGFLRSPGDPYTAAAYGKNLMRTGDSPLEPTITSDDNFFIRVSPNSPMTSAPSDSFRVESPSDVAPLTSSDKPSTTGYREVQMWADSIPTSDIKSAELVFAEPRALFRTILRDTQNPIEDTLTTYIGKIDALLGTNAPNLYGEVRPSVLDKLRQQNIPTTITVRRDYGLSPRATNAENVKETLMGLRREASQYLQFVRQYGEQSVRQRIQNEVSQLFVDPQSNYMAQLVRQGDLERAGRVFSETQLGGNANPFYPGDTIYNLGEAVAKELKSPEDVRQFIQGTVNSYLLEQMPDLPQYVYLLKENDIDGIARLLLDKYPVEQIADQFKRVSNVNDLQFVNLNEIPVAAEFLERGTNKSTLVNQRVFELLPEQVKRDVLAAWRKNESVM